MQDPVPPEVDPLPLEPEGLHSIVVVSQLPEQHSVSVVQWVWSIMQEDPVPLPVVLQMYVPKSQVPEQHSELL